MDEEDERAADAFGALGNEHRVAIVRELMVAYREGDAPLSYSALRKRLGIRDSGQFNYHLTTLLGRFVDEVGDGYALTHAGRTIAAAIASGTPHESATTATPVEGSCYACGEDALELRYVDELCRVSCGACDEELVHMPFPPAGVADRPADELATAFDWWARSWNAQVGAGVCPECGGRVSGELDRSARTPTIGDVGVRAVLRCDRCWVRGFLPPGALALDHPAVGAFYWEHGEDVRERPLWRHTWAITREGQTVVSEDPLAVRLELTRDAATLRVTVTANLDIERIDESRTP